MTRFRTRIVIATITTCAAIVAASLADVNAQGPGGGPTTYQTANLVNFETGMAIGGGATLYRSSQAVWARVATTGLDPLAAYTVWWIVWNNPGLCTGGCGEDDLGITGNAIFYATGFVSGRDGSGNVTAHLDAGQLPSGIDVLIPGSLRPGNGLRAEIHIIVRSHGPVLPGSVDEQIGSFLGGCAINTCADQQAAAFAPTL